MAYVAVNGLNMYYEIHGDGPPLLLLHGGTGSIRTGRWVAPSLDMAARHVRRQLAR